MRIIGELTHPTLKITLMHHRRYLLKLEDRDVELVYRFRDEEGIASLEDAQRILDLGLLQRTEATLAELSAERRRYTGQLIKASQASSSAGDEFPVIV